MWEFQVLTPGVREVRTAEGAQTYVGASHRPGAPTLGLQDVFSAFIYSTYQNCNILHSGTAAACLR